MTYQMTDGDWVGQGVQDALVGFILGGINCFLGLFFYAVTSTAGYIFTQTFHVYYGTIPISFFFGYGCLHALDIKRYEQFLTGYAWSHMLTLIFFIKGWHFMFIALCSTLSVLMGYGLFLALSRLGEKIGELYMQWRE